MVILTITLVQVFCMSSITKTLYWNMAWEAIFATTWPRVFQISVSPSSCFWNFFQNYQRDQSDRSLQTWWSSFALAPSVVPFSHPMSFYWAGRRPGEHVVAKIASHAIFQYNILAIDDTHNTWTNVIVKMTILRLLGSSDDKEKRGVARSKGQGLRHFAITG